MSKAGNSVTFIGRFVADPELRAVGESHVCNFCLARARDGVRVKDGENPPTEFVDFVAWGKLAENIVKYFHKGDRIGICGAIQTRIYENKTGTRVKSVEVFVNEFEWIDYKKKSENSESAPTAHESVSVAPFVADPATSDEELPF